MMESGYYVNGSGLVNSLIAQTTPCTMLGITGINTGAADEYIMIFDATTVPADATVPTFAPVRAYAGTAFSFSVPVRGVTMKKGLVICNSSTAGTKTIGSADCFLTAYLY